MVKQRMRRGEQPREPEAVVLRGRVLNKDELERDAQTNYDVYGFFGLSVWVPGRDVPAEDILRGKLVKAQIVTRFIAGDLFAMGVRLWDTGLLPHYDGVHLAGEQLDELVSAVLAVRSVALINPFHDMDGGPDR